MATPKTKPIVASPPSTNACDSAYFPDFPAGTNLDTTCTQEPYWSPDRKRILSGIMNSIDPMLQAQMGLCKAPEYLSGAATSTLNKWYYAIQVIEDSTFNVAAGNTTEKTGEDNSDVNLVSWTGKTFKAGTILYGNFSKVVLLTGFVKLMGHPFK